MIGNRLRYEAGVNTTQDRDAETEPLNSATEEATRQQQFSGGRSLLSLLLATDLVAKEKALAFIPYFLFLAFLGMIYIGNRHMAEKKSRDLTQLKKELKELKWDYMSTKAELMLQSKQSEVAIRASTLNLWESVRPPAKIIIREK